MLITLFLLLAIAAGEPGPIILAWKLEPGQSWVVEEKETGEQTFVSDGHEMTTEWKERRVSRFKVLNLDKDGNPVLEQTLLKVELTQPSDPRSKLPKGLEGAVLKWTLDLKKRQLHSEGYENLMARVGKESAIQGDLLRTALPPETLASGVLALFHFLPTKPIGQTDTWTSRSERSLGAYGAFALDTRYRLQERAAGNSDVVELAGASTLQYVPPPDSKGRAFQVRSAVIKKEKASNKVFFDVNQGRLRRSEQFLTFEVEFRLGTTDRVLMVSLAQKRTSTIEVLKKEPAK